VRHGGDATLALLERLVEHAGQSRRDIEAWSLARVMRRAEAVLLGAGDAALAPEALAERAGLAGADARRLLEELERIGVAARRGEGFSIAGAEQIARAARTLEEAGEGA
jgi:hypothetical protein